jgi:3,4-dihydroxy 2-butanone 4-phosphate synthase / GTP cyclohydrolase II
MGLTSKVQAYALQDHGLDTSEELHLPVDGLTCDLGAQILGDLGLTAIRLMSDTPAKANPLVGYALTIVESVPLSTAPNLGKALNLRTEQDKPFDALSLAHGRPSDTNAAIHVTWAA